MKDLFSSKLGGEIYASALRAIDDHHMLDHLKRGVLVGFSGGADSVMLLLLLLKLKECVCDFPIVAVHINHMIRGNEADRDEEFSRSFCKSQNVEFKAIRIDVPAISKESGTGIEEAARDARYSAFHKVIDADERISTISVAHNATDNLETVIFNMMRGAGLSGISGIPPVRDNIIRPLIYSSKSDIVAALDLCGIDYVVDSTNNDVQYTRNYIRHEIIPRLSVLTASPEAMASRMSRSLREDGEYIGKEAENFVRTHLSNGRIHQSALLTLPKPLFYRVLTIMTSEKCDQKPERTHVDAIYDLLGGGNFSYSLPGKIRFVMENGLCYIGNDIIEEDYSYSVKIDLGVTEIPGYSTVVILSDDKTFKNYTNIYKISIQQQIPSDIIKDGLSVRSKEDGDSYTYGGMTRKLKKLFNDRKIPPSLRQHVPVVCDSQGILWVPGFGLRDGARSNSGIYIAFAEPICQTDKTSIYFKAER
jgi:tRNA(Ile)-lysidine synthase